MPSERLVQALLIRRELNTLGQARSYLRRFRFKDDDILRGRNYYICRQLDQRQLYDEGYQLKLEVHNYCRKIFLVIAYR
jgi:hypothetical protein